MEGNFINVLQLVLIASLVPPRLPRADSCFHNVDLLFWDCFGYVCCRLIDRFIDDINLSLMALVDYQSH